MGRFMVGAHADGFDPATVGSAVAGNLSGCVGSRAVSHTLTRAGSLRSGDLAEINPSRDARLRRLARYNPRAYYREAGAGALIAGSAIVGYMGEDTDAAELAAVLRRMHAGWHSEDSAAPTDLDLLDDASLDQMDGDDSDIDSMSDDELEAELDRLQSASVSGLNYRDVKGAGGWGYRQFEDGSIQITADPRAGSPLAGKTLTTGSAWQAITDEIGPVTQEDAKILSRIKFSHPDDDADHKRKVRIAGRTVKVQSPVLLEREGGSAGVYIGNVEGVGWEPRAWDLPEMNDGWRGEYTDAPFGPRAMGLDDESGRFLWFGRPTERQFANIRQRHTQKLQKWREAGPLTGRQRQRVKLWKHRRERWGY